MSDHRQKDWPNKDEYIYRGGNVFKRDMDGRKSIQQVPSSQAPKKK